MTKYFTKLNLDIVRVSLTNMKISKIAFVKTSLKKVKNAAETKTIT